MPRPNQARSVSFEVEELRVERSSSRFAVRGDEGKLSPREMQILEAIVRNFILTGLPTGSRFLSKRRGMDFSAATIRNVMGDLEERGLLEHPHTSAGRVPTDKGFRFYVDHLIRLIEVPREVRQKIRGHLARVEPSDLHMLMEATSEALSKVTSQLGLIMAPKLREGVYRHIHLHEVESGRYLMNLAIDSGFVKSMVVEVNTQLDAGRLERASNIMNARLQGVALGELCDAGDDLFEGFPTYDIGVIRLFLPSIRKLVQSSRRDEVFAEGEANIMLKPEFFDKEHAGAIVEILGQKRLLLHMLKSGGNTEMGEVKVTIGSEARGGKFTSMSIVKTGYNVGHMKGTLGIVGPKRMPYGFLISAVDYTAKALSDLYS